MSWNTEFETRINYFYGAFYVIINLILVLSLNFKQFEILVLVFEIWSYGSSRPKVFCKNSVLRNFTKFTGKQLCQSLFLNKVAGLEACDFI